MISELQAEILELAKFKNPEVLKLVFSKLDKNKPEKKNLSLALNYHKIILCTDCNYKENMSEWDQYAFEKKKYNLDYVRKHRSSYEIENSLLFRGMRLERFRPCKKCLQVNKEMTYQEYLKYNESAMKYRKEFKEAIDLLKT